MRLLLAIGIMLCLAAPEHGHARTVEGTVKTVYDGDSLLLVTRGASRIKVRLYGIDAPETSKPDKPGQPLGEAAEQALAGKVMRRTVVAEIIEIDQYRRLVAVVRYAGRDINREMVTEGMAWAYRHYLQGPYASEYIGAEERARSRRLGLWRDSNPQPPWEFRQRLKRGPHSGNRHK